MSAFKQRLARAGVSVALLASVTAAMLAVCGVGASSAFAAECTKGTLTGKGSTLQNEAQKSIWIPHYCAVDTTERYTPVYDGGGSGAGLEAWRFTGAGTLNHEYQYIGTDDAPTAAQITHAREAAGSANVVVVPVGQTAISIVVHPPSGCTLTKITNAALEEAFSGKATTWAAIGGTGTCTGTLTRVVRAEGSGTTFQFKNYLSKINAGAPCAGSPTTWAELEPLTTPNITWPKCGTMEPETAAGGGAVAETVKNMEGTIGYAALPDAKAKGATVIEVQNGETGGKKTFAKPGTEEEEEGKKGFANCAKAVYDVPAAGQETGSGLNVDWSGVFGGNPSINTGYSICTLTYVLAWDNYETAGFSEGAATVGGVSGYVGTIVTEGTLGTSKRWYSVLPTPTAATENVQKAAEFASGLIGVTEMTLTPANPVIAVGAERVMTLKNTGTVPVIVTAIETNLGATTFELLEPGGTCKKTFNPGVSCEFTVKRLKAGAGVLFAKYREQGRTITQEVKTNLN